ncbi:MAG: TetR/AcrR family transcriptional regulator C-terminal domain-containing protein [Actinomycetia bacterium]|nr:TetR/AcrR family transcriptional regulator C-terminal domain-containing protein [Actinomycetes bacterium]
MPLHRDDILDSAVEVLKEYGLGDLSMRRLARQLGVQPGALYWHFPDKQALLTAIAQVVIDSTDESMPDGRWDAQLAELARRLRRALLAYRDGAELIASVSAMRRLSRPREQFIGVLVSAGMATPDANDGADALLHYVIGHTLDEQSHAQLSDYGVVKTVDDDPERRFEFGLRAMIDGLATRTTPRRDDNP